MTNGFAELVPASGSVPAGCGVGLLSSWMGGICSQTRRDTNFAIPGYSISAIIPRRGRKSKIFLSVVIYVVKAAFVPFSAIGGNPVNAGVTRLCGVFPYPVPDTATAPPNDIGSLLTWEGGITQFRSVDLITELPF